MLEDREGTLDVSNMYIITQGNASSSTTTMPPSFNSRPYHVSEESMEEQRLGAMIVIFAISLFAVFFPTISKYTSHWLPIPKVVFFIGKHFGTGVILSTAFCHLLQDSFGALHSPEARREYPKVGDNIGLIILGSLLAIFLVEYISTSYVDHLHAEPSVPPSREPSLALSRTPTTESQHAPIPPTTSAPASSHHEETPLLAGPQRSHHSRHIPRTPLPQHFLSSILTNSPRHSRSTDSFYIINDIKDHLNNGEYHMVGGDRCVCVTMCPHRTVDERGRSQSKLQITAEPIQEEPEEMEDVDVESLKEPRIGRKRQVVGILVLQLGIMIHSLVIGLTLAITRGVDFTSLVTAIIFHQLFEGLSLGIRTASLPPAQPPSRAWLQPTLGFLFAITTPAGMVLGMVLFSSASKGSETKMLLTQGLMSAISAGMLIYAATVEMIGGDFVFGTLGHGGGHGHSHSHGSELLDEQGTHEEEGVSPKKKILAVLSLLAGVAMMGLVGIGE